MMRKILKPDLFETEQYRQNLKSYLAQEGEYSKPFRIARGFSEYGVGEDVEVYALNRGIFNFYFIEEKGELRVLTLGFEL